MTDHEASRTLVKSPPELWAACSDPAILGRHLEPFGKIRITRLEPETTVAWEGERASGTVRIEPSGWGTRVTLTAAAKDGVAFVAAEPAAAPSVAPEAEPEPAVEPQPEPEAEPGLELQPESEAEAEPGAEPERPAISPAPAFEAPRGLLGRLLARLRGPRPRLAPARPAPVPGSDPLPLREPDPVAAPAVPSELVDSAATLRAALDSLGQAHHRPFSRG